MQERNSLREYLDITVHVISWGIIFFFPYLMMMRVDVQVPFYEYVTNNLPRIAVYLLLFYLNYNLLIPRLLLRRRIWGFIGSELALAYCCSIAAFFLQYFEWRNMQPIIIGNDGHQIEIKDFVVQLPVIVRVQHEFLFMVLIAIISIAIRMTVQWNRMEKSKRESEHRRIESELQQLHSQLNPHFLLNTLNNIYALIAFDAEKAQEAVQELSRLLRHTLYDNRQSYTTLQKEADFIRNYIALMRIRLSPNVTVETSFDLQPEHGHTPIAPLIFISLIENAFKHGISPTEPSHICIGLSEHDGRVRCEIRNSNHRKVGNDRNGSGIGLQQVQKRLELMYPESHRWSYGLSNDGKEYISVLEIDTKNALPLQ